MPAQTQTNATAVKLGAGFLQANAAAAKSTTVLADNSRLPDGIENGVARVVSMKIMPIGAGKGNAGKPMFMAQAVVVKPEFHEGVKVAGRRTSFMEMLFDTPGKKRATVKDHVEHVYAHLRMWGVDTNMLAACKTEAELTAKLNSIFELLSSKKKITISFRTWKGQVQTTGPYAGKEPMTNETWGGLAQAVPDAAPPEAAVQDDSPTDDTPADDVVDDVPPDDGDTPDMGDAGAELSDEDVDALVTAADDGPEGQEKDDAGVKLEDWCKATNPALEDEAVRAKATNWAELVEWARNGVPAEDEGVKVGDVRKYRTPSGGPGKPPKNVQVEVKKLYKVKGADVCDALNLTDKRTIYKVVPVEKLEAA